MISFLKISACLFALCIANDVNSQPTFTGAPGHINFNYDSSYEVAETRFQCDLLSAFVTFKKNKKVFASFYRWNDTAFAFTGYDTSGNLKEQGLIVIDFSNAIGVTMQFPDVVNDPSGSEGLLADTTLSPYVYSKQGTWRSVSRNCYWEGHYDKNKKQGLWLHYFYRPGHMPMPLADSACVYKSDSLITFNYSELATDSVAKLLYGNWYFNGMQSGRFIHNYNKANTSSKPRYQFADDFTFKDYGGAGKFKEGNWEVTNNSLILRTKESKRLYQIVFLNENQLVLRSEPL